MYKITMKVNVPDSFSGENIQNLYDIIRFSLLSRNEELMKSIVEKDPKYIIEKYKEEVLIIKQMMDSLRIEENNNENS